MGERKKNIYTVAQINSYIKNMFSQDFMLSSVYIRGEISNCKYHSSGHIYFTLKDQKGTMACVMFAGNRSGLSFPLKDGQQVVVGGNVDVYERDGKYQLYAKIIELDGVGSLYEQFELLKKELDEMGMFSPIYKRKIPSYVKTIGVVTAPTGAAVRDIIQISQRRNPYVQIILYPAIVQGELAADSIVAGIKALTLKNVDVLIVGRGGGSIEDLWAFNERKVAQAIFDCPIPVISAVGHETDTTIADYVADLRAPTPSAAAELAVYSFVEMKEHQEKIQQTLYRLLKNNIIQNKRKVENYKLRLQRVSPSSQLQQKRMYILHMEENLKAVMDAKLSSKKYQYALLLEKMKGLSPYHKLEMGFSYVTDKTGRTLTDVNRVEIDDTIQVALKNGLLSAKVMSKEEIGREECEYGK